MTKIVDEQVLVYRRSESSPLYWYLPSLEDPDNELPVFDSYYVYADQVFCAYRECRDGGVRLIAESMIFDNESQLVSKGFVLSSTLQINPQWIPRVGR